MHIPGSTYRVQLNKDFTFRDLAAIIDYLDELGITMIYSAPMFKATPGSNHGYDVTDPHEINPEIGTLGEFAELSRKLKEKNIRWLQDIVPNHMAFNAHNHRLMDVLERGDLSEYHSYFDIDWKHPAYGNQLMVPALGRELDEAIKEHEIRLTLKPNGIFVCYYDKQYPLSVPGYAKLIALSFPKQLSDLAANASRSTRIEWNAAKTKWFEAFTDDERESRDARDVLEKINRNTSDMASVLSELHYRLTWWKETEREINYRRFFTINDLICLRMEDPWVFNEYHQFLLELYKKGMIHGLRIDHIDGLHDPTQYVHALRDLFGEQCYIVAEKILEAEEDMPAYWPLQGASGYQFLSSANQVFTHREGAGNLLNFYRKLVPELSDYNALVLEKKKLIVENYMAGERDNLVRLLFESGLQGSYDETTICNALTALMISLPVYRIYPRQIPVKGNNLKVLRETFGNARLHQNGADALDHLEKLFTTEPGNHRPDQILFFLRRLMQFTGPVTAKGVEDTTFYIYNPLISHDEVGDSPETLGISIEDFHDRMATRQNRVPMSLNATATHDTKRGEDARMRLNVLSEFSELWIDRVAHWTKMNAQYRAREDGRVAPALNDEYFIYQSMVGGFPADLTPIPGWQERLGTYLVKAFREAKMYSNWEDPDEFYEKGCMSFVREILKPGHGFLKDFTGFLKEILPSAYTYSLAQPLLKITAPGIPDIYQGCELWDLSFVDPDNRRPVDYQMRTELLSLLKQKSDDVVSLMSFLDTNRELGAGKMYVTWKALRICRDFAKVFVHGDYLPLRSTEGNTILAFARRYDRTWFITAIRMNHRGNSRSRLLFPEHAPRKMIDHFTGNNVSTQGEIHDEELFRNFPVVLLSNTIDL